jgi:glutamyl-tRNA synthetase
MPVDKLTDALIPIWQEAGYDVSDRAYLSQIVGLIGQSLMRLQDAVEMAKVFFADKLEFSEEATAHFKQEGAIASLKAILAALENQPSLTETTAGEIIKQVTKELGVKKGLVMRSLRVGLTGELHGPDLTQSWLILHQKGLDKPRLQQTIEKLS